MAAAGVASVAYLVAGDKKQALIAAAGIALAAVGVGAAVIGITKIVKTSGVAGRLAARAAPKVERAKSILSTAATTLRKLSGREIKIGKNVRIAPLGNRTGHPTGGWPHYHRRVVNDAGDSMPGQGIGRHRPWDKKSTDKSFWNRF